MVRKYGYIICYEKKDMYNNNTIPHRACRVLKDYNDLMVFLGYIDSPFFYEPTKKRRVIYAPFYLYNKRLLAKHRSK